MKENKCFLTNIEVIADAKKKNQIIPFANSLCTYFSPYKSITLAK